MRRALQYVLCSIVLLLEVSPEAAVGQDCWWQRGADSWYCKDDWKGLKITGASPLRLDIDMPAPAVGGWVVVWGEGDGRLYVNDQLVDKDLDPCLIWDYDLAPFLRSGPRRVTVRLDARAACAEGEILGRDGVVRRFATDANWVDARGNPVKTEKMRVMASRDAFDKAHNGRLLAYNEEERGKSTIAKCLARVQKLREQSIFLLRRFRPAEEIVSFDPSLPWRQAERIAGPLLDQAQQILRQQSIPAQQAGRFAEAISSAQRAETLIAAAEAPVIVAIALYKGHREITHVANWAAMLDTDGRAVDADVAELSRLVVQARREYGQRDWASVHKDLDRLGELSAQLRPRLLAVAQKKVGLQVCDVGNLDEFPEDRFGWLNARDLMGNDPSLWPFTAGPSSAGCLPLAGRWEFRLDPNNAGASNRWYEGASTDGWTSISVPKPWERQGYNFDNLKSPGDAPYRAPMSGDKPYNGYAWYRKQLVVPENWQGERLMLRLGKVRDWYRVFVNGRPLGEGTRVGEDRQLSPDETVSIASEAVRFGVENVIVIQVYNHNNFGGIVAGRPALYVEGQEPQFIETPGPLSYAHEFTYQGQRPISYSALASAMSPGVIVACDQNSLELWGWQAKGHNLPESIAFAGRSGYETIRLVESGSAVPGDRLSEKWLVIRGGGADALLVLEQPPQMIAWQKNAQGSMSLVLRFADRPARAVALSMPAGVSLNEQQCKFWAAILRKYPVSVSECVWRDTASRCQSCLVWYNYLDVGQDETNAAVAGAPVPMLASFGCQHKSPGLTVEGVERTGYTSPHASYMVQLNSDTLAYRMPVPDRSKMMKGVGELFARSRVESNVHGGLGEKEMFHRMAEWGFDHCRYALAFDAQWDLPLVNFRSGSISGDETLWKRLDELIANCNEAGMQMMLCSFPEIRSRDWKARPDRQRTMFEFWRRIAQRYANLPEWAISYDFFNEPAYMNTGHYNEIMKELTTIVRSVDQRHMIVWEPGDGWAQPQWCSWMEPVRDANVLYSFHNYGKHWGYAYDEYYPGSQATFERTQVDPWLEAILFGIEHNAPIHCGEFGLSMIQPGSDGPTWLDDYLAFFERFGIGWNWWNYSGTDIYRTGLAMGDRISPYVPILQKWMAQSGWGRHGPAAQQGAGSGSQSGGSHE
jgi:hypothetical protein